MLSRRVIDIFSPEYPHKALHLFTNNDKVDAFNETALISSNDVIYEVKAKDRVVNSISSEAKNNILQTFLKNKKMTNSYLLFLSWLKDSVMISLLMLTLRIV